MTVIHPRHDWQPRPPRRQVPVDPSLLRGICIHWAGYKINADTPTSKTLRAIQNFHLDQRSWYDIAYQFAVDQSGDVWELRGLDIENGAQGGRRLNRRYIAVVALLGPGQPPTSSMVDGLRAAVAHVRARYPQCEDIVGHCDVKATQCPGLDLLALVRNGQLEQSAVPVWDFTLRRGATGEPVARLQGVLGGLEVDGQFGPATEARLLEVQGCVPHLAGHPDGTCGADTWAFVEACETLGD